MEVSWAFKKTRALDELIEVTLSMLGAYQNGQFDESLKFVQKRTLLTNQLQECDHHIDEPNDDMVEKWLEQINQIKDLDEQIEQHFKIAKQRLQEEEPRLAQIKVEKKEEKIDTVARLNSPISQLISKKVH